MSQDGLNIMHCAAINNHTEIVEYIVDDLQMKELDKEDQVWLFKKENYFFLQRLRGIIKSFSLLSCQI